MKKTEIFGYKRQDGALVLHPVESEMVKYIFEKHNEYCEHPPKDLVLAQIEKLAFEGRRVSYEEAEALVPYERILQRITDEVNGKWVDYLNKKRLKKFNFKDFIPQSDLEKSVKTIIGEEDWNRLKAFCYKGMDEERTGVQLTP